MLQALVRSATQLYQDARRSLQRQRRSAEMRAEAVVSGRCFRRLQRLRLTDDVTRTLFDGFASHRKAARGDEETGWVLLGLREEEGAVALAALPAGANCDASASHVQFNSNAQALGSRIVRQYDRRIVTLGVVHTHPGSLRHPSDADFRGDSRWVKQLRGGEGIFGIGTADGDPQLDSCLFAHQPKPHLQCLGELCFSWYALHYDDGGYRPLTVEMTLGPDLARPLHSVWAIIEAHADRLDRVLRQQIGVTFDVVPGDKGQALAMNVPLADSSASLRVVLDASDIHYFLKRNGELLKANCQEDRVDRGVYLLLAELTARQ